MLLDRLVEVTAPARRTRPPLADLLAEGDELIALHIARATAPEATPWVHWCVARDLEIDLDPILAAVRTEARRAGADAGAALACVRRAQLALAAAATDPDDDGAFTRALTRLATAWRELRSVIGAVEVR